MSKIKQTANGTVDDAGATTAQRRRAPVRIMSHSEVSDVMSRARRMQARAIGGFFTNLGK